MAAEPIDDPSFRIGLIGTGYIGTTVGGEFHRHSRATVAAVSDIDDEARAEAGDLFSVPSASRYADYKAMMDGEALDGVLVGTPHTLHYEQISEALDRGLHVLCDKPLTTDLDRARELTERAETGDQTLMVGYQRHLNPAFVAARERWLGSDRSPRWITAEVTQNWVDRFEETWRMNPELNGGGYLWDTGSHLLDAVLWSSGLTPTAVSADMDFVDDDRRVDSRARLTIRFDGGATATVSTFGDAPCTREHIHMWDDDGAVYLEGREWESRELVTIDGESTERRPYIDNRAQRTKAEAFVTAVRTGEDPPATARDGLRVTAVTEAAYEAARSGDWVEVDLD
ncbi:Gfo/Idh/MocA family protein [Halegenticoccus tardaugens]|uniref:Gfo/Idh/MocA family protein n=1 Tax=Halegenticoccus tardaugens TaxID=2071624 RepID=UPI00100B9837|nr:Gfo/Idh/MocA family oxidoreductase [Halegenticoccus tardaugens]